ncbi:MAG: methylated-DNA--[protein]-cysteine S-methyltransferase [Ignavibacteriaceae bacterium]
MMEENENLYYAASNISGIHFKVFTSRKGIRKIFINNKNASIENASVTALRPDDPYMFNVFKELTEYFNRERKKFSVPLEIQGTEFQRKVWQQLMKIPYGKTISYLKLAENLGDAKAVRAVGKANGSNPISIIIPCHRVINFDGKLGGYSGGLDVKEKLLALEGGLSLELFEK